MKKNTVILLIAGVLVYFLWKRGNTTTSVEVGKTIGITPATGATIQSLINGLVNIFGDRNSSLSPEKYDSMSLLG